MEFTTTHKKKLWTALSSNPTLEDKKNFHFFFEKKNEKITQFQSLDHLLYNVLLVMYGTFTLQGTFFQRIYTKYRQKQGVVVV